MSKKTETIKIDEIVEKFFVRDRLSDDRVEQFSKLYAEGADIPPIIVAKVGDEFHLVDGRHRKQGRQIAGFDDIPAVIMTFENQAEMIVYAFKANIGGALPPSESDIRRTLNLLFEEGMARKTIIDKLVNETSYPIAVLRNYMDDVQTDRAHKKLQNAIDAITEDGLTVPQAADKFKIEVSKIKEALSGKKKNKPSTWQEIISGLSTRYHKHGASNSKTFQRMARDLEEGTLKPDGVDKIFAQIRRLVKREIAYIDQWEKRMKAVR